MNLPASKLDQTYRHQLTVRVEHGIMERLYRYQRIAMKREGRRKLPITELLERLIRWGKYANKKSTDALKSSGPSPLQKQISLRIDQKTMNALKRAQKKMSDADGYEVTLRECVERMIASAPLQQ